MMFDVSVLRTAGVRPDAVVHVGAHVGQEAGLYRSLGIRDVLWVEANADLIDELARNVARFGHRVVCACVAAVDGDTVTFHVAESDDGSNRGQSSSVLELGTHASCHPDVRFVEHRSYVTATLDSIVETHAPEWFDGRRLLINTDVQGFERDVFAGASRVLAAAWWVVTEVNIDELYRGACLFEQFDPWMVDRGFECMHVTLAGCRRRDCSDRGNRWVGWGDALYERRPGPLTWAETHPADAADWFPGVRA